MLRRFEPRRLDLRRCRRFGTTFRRDRRRRVLRRFEPRRLDLRRRRRGFSDTPRPRLRDVVLRRLDVVLRRLRFGATLREVRRLLRGVLRRRLGLARDETFTPPAVRSS